MVRRAFIQHHQKKLLSALKIMNSKLEIIGVEDGNVVRTNFYIYNIPTHENLILNNSRLKRSFEFKHVHLYLRFEFSFTRSLKAKLRVEPSSRKIHETINFRRTYFMTTKKRSHWTVTVNGSKAQIDGILRIQVHYYEDGNVQLLSKKDASHELSVESGIIDQTVSYRLGHI